MFRPYEVISARFASHLLHLGVVRFCSSQLAAFWHYCHLFERLRSHSWDLRDFCNKQTAKNCWLGVGYNHVQLYNPSFSIFAPQATWHDSGRHGKELRPSTGIGVAETQDL